MRIHEKLRGVKCAKPQSDATLPPLPPQYRHLTTLLDNIPPHDIASCILACAHVGFNDDAIAEALRTLGEHHQATDHRCTTCLTWTTDAIFAGYVDDSGKFAVVTFCARCQKLITAGRATPTMQRNLLAYGLGLDEVAR